MMFTAPLGLLALLAIPAIVAIHLFRRRFPTRPVAGLFLWQVARRTPEGGGKIARLPITASLLLECLAALALALIVAGARLTSAHVSEHLVVVLDDSASMAAVNAGGESSRDRALRRVLEEIDRQGARGRVTLVQSGLRPSVLAGPAVLAADAKQALVSWKPEAPHHSLALAIRLGRELAKDTGRVMVVSDLMPAARREGEFDGGLWVSVGQPQPNVAITAAQRTISPDDQRGTVSLTLANYSNAAARRRLDIFAGDTRILSRELDVPAGSSSITLPIAARLPAVRVAIADDALRRDNEVVLAEPRLQIVGVANRLVDGRGRDALTKALDALSGITHTEPGHLVFTPAGDLAQPASAGVWRVGFGRPPTGWVQTGEPQDFIGPFVIEKRHPALLGVTLAGVVWTGAVPITPGVISPLVSVSDQTLVGVSGGPASGAAADPAFLINLDLERTNVIRAPDWPILISNLVELRRQNLPGPERWNYRIGEWIRVRLARDPTGPLRFRCGAIERTLPAARDIEFMAPSPGGLLQILEGNEVLFTLGVNFHDEAEADLRPQASDTAGSLGDAPGLQAESGPASDPLFWILLAVAGMAIVGNWWLLSPAVGRA